MSRSTQIIGFKEGALEIAQDLVKCLRTVAIEWPCGAVAKEYDEVLLPRSEKEKYDHFEGMFHEEFPLHKWTREDGKVFFEAVQADPWSSGPCFFLALKDEDGEWIEETLWDEAEFAKA